MKSTPCEILRTVPTSMRQIALLTLLLAANATQGNNLDDVITHGFADNNGVKIHYVSAGRGPLVVMIHGFPDFWYTWRKQMAVLRSEYQVVALDQRGYNLSDKPQGVAAYASHQLVADVAAAVKANGHNKATIVGHDWGGWVAWDFASTHPEMTEHLVVLNVPHRNGFLRELSNNPKQRANSAYAQRFKEGRAHDQDILFGKPMTVETLAAWVSEPQARQRYETAFRRSDFTAMLNFYKANYPDLPEAGAPVTSTFPTLNMPVLIFHGLKDYALLADGLNHTWDWIGADLTLVTTPNAAHFVHHDASALVTTTLQWWLRARTQDR